jgi:methylene-tetrahydromethanopterin dehydrogenase
MTQKHILHMVTPLKHMSPFDINMAIDAGFDAVVPYTNVQLSEISGLVQDAIFSRPPSSGPASGFFIAGKDAILALDMVKAARGALVPPFELSIFADPAGSFTTAAAMVAGVESVLRSEKKTTLSGLRIAVFGGTGVVGFSSAVIAALEGAHVILVGHDGAARVQRSAEEIKRRFGVAVTAADGSTAEKIDQLLLGVQAVFCAARAGLRILSSRQLNNAPNLLIVADVNAVPPSGIEGLDMTAKGIAITPSGTLGIGPLAIGNIKYQSEFALFRNMLSAQRPVCFDFRDAFALARTLNG